jgi:hypothetical protein
MVELAVILPFMMLLFLGSWTAAALIGDNDTALQATRAGARYAAELGNSLPPGQGIAPVCSGVGVSDPDTCTVDQDIISQMLPVVNGSLPNAVVSEIDIYRPVGSGSDCTFGVPGCPPSGAYQSGDPVDVYGISGNTVAPSGLPATYGYPLGLRDQTHPFEAELGVRITFTYTSPTMSLFTQTDHQYTVVRLAPTE